MFDLDFILLFCPLLLITLYATLFVKGDVYEQ